MKEALNGGAAAGATAGVGGGIAAGAHAIAAAYVDSFLSAGSSLVDAEDIAAANATYRASMMFDERAPNDPTRRLGIAPNCQTCGRDAGERGTFVDDYGRRRENQGRAFRRGARAATDRVRAPQERVSVRRAVRRG